MVSLHLVPEKAALILIDLQRGIVANNSWSPHTSKAVVQNAARLLRASREKGVFIVKVRVSFLGGQDALKPITDQPPQSVSRPEGWDQLIEELGDNPNELVVTKRQWGAFFGTELDLQLRRRGIETIILCGIATNIGVETTAREAFQHGYQQIFVEDAMTAPSAEEHNHTIQYIFPRIGVVRTTEDVLSLL